MNNAAPGFKKNNRIRRLLTLHLFDVIDIISTNTVDGTI